ncbi:4-hydroxy-2-oxovalerate aldolase [Alicyclobacillus acidoterrestris]|uniref:4-hydroxy-2-oxovalerate aldolase n=1 Tax=Alicyclobacillus acidoterrestris (strain ATCC 49025 / DSM 3922 / CIP 106132 / NCIMB 13137 / GD3B) TaxID=1356854 RepID=T0CU24_ALIAG|nr:4-hydroxy-2-oxovalerate aldolase [Alicyclobacillus acidoterrestris]EPZ42912.1 4-hyroxy-2-oxovalerate aldolase [Alicyclobacillus acidoterrestris ATCC 49025]UNO50069.1 4-hydroxy-2-oxovalerate aldolase [Alicyclobacillus acidoterrestris]
MAYKYRIELTDVTLRDGMHAVRHQFSVEDASAIASALDGTGVALIEATHGDGLGGSSVQYGFSKETEADYLRAVCGVVSQSKVAALLLPGIGTVEDLKRAVECGIQAVRVATHSTEADISAQHIEEARKLGLDTVGFLMMSHMTPTERLVEEANKMASYGAHAVYIVDSAGAMLMDEVRAKVSALRNALPDDVQVGFHAHNNLGVSVANSIAAVEEGAFRIDASLGGLGAGAGNTPLEVFVAACEKYGIDTGVQLYPVMDAAEDVVRPRMHRPIITDRTSLTLGYAGVYSSFLLHAQRAAEQFSVDTRDVLVELGRRKVVGGQEDMIVDVAFDIAHGKAAATH